MLFRISRLLLALATSLCATFAFAQTELSVATIAPEGTPWVDHLETWKTNLEKQSGSDLTLAIFPGGQLGNEIDTFRQSQRGRVDIIMISGGALSEQFKEVSLMSTPFLFDRVETIDCIYAGQIGDVLAHLIGGKGVELLRWSETGWVNVFARDNLSDIGSIKAYKARVAHHDVSRMFWNAVEANGIELPYVELATALQTGMVNAGEATGISYVAFGFDKIAPHFVQTRHSHQAGAILISQRSLRKLTADQQDWLRNSMPALAELRRTVRGKESELITQYAAEGGLVHDLTADQRAEWRKQIKSSWPDFVAGLGQNAQVLWPDLLAAKSSCGE